MKKAFTLVELLAVIIILGIIATITFPIVTSSIRNSKNKAYDIQVRELEESARKWAVANSDSLSETTPTTVTISNLISSGYITKTENGNIVNPKDDSVMNGCVIITYSSSYNQYLYEYSETCNIPE